MKRRLSPTSELAPGVAVTAMVRAASSRMRVSRLHCTASAPGSLRAAAAASSRNHDSTSRRRAAGMCTTGQAPARTRSIGSSSAADRSAARHGAQNPALQLRAPLLSSIWWA
jgi:hypothetical protein